ncbi:hypothetical protein D3C81_330930 [compost metagenome]
MGGAQITLTALAAGTAEGATHIAKQLGFHQIGGQGAAVDTHQGLVPPARLAVQGAHQMLLATAGLPLDEQGDAALQHLEGHPGGGRRRCRQRLGLNHHRLGHQPQAAALAQQLLAIEGVLAEPEPASPVGPEQFAPLPQQQAGRPETLRIEIHQPARLTRQQGVFQGHGQQPHRAQHVAIVMGRIGGDVEHPQQLPVRPEQGAGAATEEAVLGEEVLVAEHLYLAPLGEGGADGVGALARLPPAGATAQEDALGVAGEAIVTAGGQDGPLTVAQQQATGSARQQLGKQRQHEALEAGDKGSVLLLAGRQLPLGQQVQLGALLAEQALMQAALPGTQDGIGTGLR